MSRSHSHIRGQQMETKNPRIKTKGNNKMHGNNKERPTFRNGWLKIDEEEKEDLVSFIFDFF